MSGKNLDQQSSRKTPLFVLLAVIIIFVLVIAGIMLTDKNNKTSKNMKSVSAPKNIHGLLKTLDEQPLMNIKIKTGSLSETRIINKPKKYLSITSENKPVFVSLNSQARQFLSDKKCWMKVSVPDSKAFYNSFVPLNAAGLTYETDGNTVNWSIANSVKGTIKTENNKIVEAKITSGENSVQTANFSYEETQLLSLPKVTCKK